MAILIKSEGTARTVESKPFDTEEQLQLLLAESPQLLQQAGDAPLALVAREVDLEEAGFLDLLFVDANGLPVAVEAKLERNSQSRREVVAQVIDYMSAITTLTVDELDERVGGNLEAALRSFSSSESSDAEFERRWRSAGANLRGGLARLVVALDGAPPGLERIFRFLARNSNLDVRLLAVEQHDAGTSGNICVPNLLVSPSSDGSRPELSTERTPLAELSAVVSMFNSTTKTGLQAVGRAPNYRQIRPREWAGGFRTHFEFVQSRELLFADLHLESDAALPLAAKLSPLAGTQVAGGTTSLVWDSNWSSGRGRLSARFPLATPPQIVVAAMEDLIRLTRAQVAVELAALQKTAGSAC